MTSFLYDGLFRDNGDSLRPNILSAMFPLTARRLDEGLIVGPERVITKKNGTASWDPTTGEWDFTVTGSLYVNRNPLRPPLSAFSPPPPKHGGGTSTGALVRVFGRDGLLKSSGIVSLSDGTVEVTAAPAGVVVIVCLHSP